MHIENLAGSKHDDLIYDVGMHKGEDTEFYLKKGFIVIGFEADPDLVEYCNRKFASEIEQSRLIIIEGAIVDPSFLVAGQQTIKFYKNMEVSVWGTVFESWANRNEMLGTQNKAIEVKAVDLADCLKHYGIPYYMKIDIEGSDTICLKALRDFSPKPTYISIESDKVDFKRLEDEINLLEQLGYIEFKAVQQANISNHVVPNPSREGRYVSHKFQPDSSGLFGKELPGLWKSKTQILKEYKAIFVLYRLFGNYSALRRSRVGRFLIEVLAKMLRRPIPGWYDTHARLGSAGQLA